LFGIHSASDLGAALTSETLQKTVAEIAPLIGILTSAYNSAQAWRAVGSVRLTASITIIAQSWIFFPAMAGGRDGIITLLERRLANESVTPRRNTGRAGRQDRRAVRDLGTATNTALGWRTPLRR